MKYTDREGHVTEVDSGQDKLLRTLYTTMPGRVLLKPLVQPWVSKLGGWCLNRGVSSLLIEPFVKKNEIEMEQYSDSVFTSYNAFFKRQIKPEYRPIDRGEKILISPCDGKLSVEEIKKDSSFTIKHTRYSLQTLLRSKRLAEYFEGGTACIFRLTVDDYHRFCYVDDGKKSRNYRIPGVFHTVNPIANETYPIYKENTREYCLLKTKHFGTAVMMEVGALMVGKIVNYEEAGTVKKGQEKGCFEFGGSTVVLLLKKDAVIIEPCLIAHTKKGYETIVKMGERIGQA